MKRKLVVCLVVLFTVILGSGTFAQSIGKLLTKSEADILFGKPVFSFTLEKKVFDKIFTDTSTVFLFNVNKNKLAIFDRKKNLVYPDTVQMSTNEIYFIYSRDKLQELLDASKVSNSLSIEMRESTLTITSGQSTLEYAWPCPPMCP